MKFKYRDKVRIICGINIDETGEVIGVDTLDTSRQYFVRYGTKHLDCGWYREDELESISQETIANEKKIAVIEKFLEVNGIDYLEEFYIKGLEGKTYRWNGTSFKSNCGDILDQYQIGVLICNPDYILKKKPKKKMTHEEIEEALGYDFELVEDGKDE